MELIDYLRVISRRKVLIIVLVAVITIGGVLLVEFLPEAQYTSISLAVGREGKQETQDYKYDGFYSLQASELFAETVVSWFLSPEIVSDIFEGAGIDPGTENLREMSRIFDAEQLASQNVLVKFTTNSEEDADKLVASMKKVLAERTKILNEASGDDANFAVIARDPITVPRNPELWLTILISFIVGVVVSFGVAFLADYMEKNREMK